MLPVSDDGDDVQLSVINLLYKKDNRYILGFLWAIYQYILLVNKKNLKIHCRTLNGQVNGNSNMHIFGSGP